MPHVNGGSRAPGRPAGCDQLRERPGPDHSEGARIGAWGTVPDRPRLGASPGTCFSPSEAGLVQFKVPPVTWHRHRPLTPCHGPAASHARGAPSQLPAPRRASRDMPAMRALVGLRRRQAAWAGGRAMHLTPTPTAESTRGDTFGGPGARPLSSRAGAAGAMACRRDLDGPHAAVRAPISLGTVADEGPGVRHRWRADDDACPSANAPHQTLS